MASYAISREGVAAMYELSRRLGSIYDDLERARNNLLDSINSISDGLGIYEKDILLLARKIVIQMEQAREAIAILKDRAFCTAQIMEGLLPGMDGGESDGSGSTDDEWPDPPVKQKVLRRWR